MKTETFPIGSGAAFAAAVAAAQGRRKRPTARKQGELASDAPKPPRAPPDAPTGISGKLAPKTGSGDAAWSLAFEPNRGYRLYVLGSTLDTGWHASEKAAVDAAKGLSDG